MMKELMIYLVGKNVIHKKILDFQQIRLKIFVPQAFYYNWSVYNIFLNIINFCS